METKFVFFSSFGWQKYSFSSKRNTCFVYKYAVENKDFVSAIKKEKVYN